MFQRIQSIYMLVAMAMISLTYFIPYGVFTDGVMRMAVSSYGLKTQGGDYLSEPSGYYIYLVHTLVLVLMVYSLISFKKRALQIRLLRFSFLVVLASIALIALYINAARTSFPSLHFSIGISLFLPIGAVLFNWLALRGVKKDEELVRSVDRIR
jgi:glucan phosphoethanolaminetransferase (alkaline phosphatase superfamily)